jgi:hypothetical protein
MSSTVGPISPKRRWLRFSLRTLLIATALLCAWVALQAHRARQQAAAIASIHALGGTVMFDYQRDNQGGYDRNVPPTISASSAWLRRVLGEDHFRRVAVVDLNMSARSIRPNGLVDAELAMFRDLPDVEIAELSNSPSITDEGLAHLAGLSKLKTLYLYNTGISGRGLRHLSGLQSLEALDVSNSPFTDEGIEPLRQFPRLRWLQLSNTRITDSGLRHLSTLQSLTDLQLMNTDVSDAGLEHIQCLASLKQVALHDSVATGQGLERLRQALPGCSVGPPPDRLRPPRDIPLWPADYRPLRSELVAAVKELSGSLHEDQASPGKPVVYFMLFDSDISDASLLRILAEMPDLEKLNLRHLVVGDALLEGLSQHSKLREVHLDDTLITDEGLQHLTSLPQLRQLTLAETRISDAGLLPLRRIKSLKYVRVPHTRVSTAGMRAFKQAMPGCAIVR